MRQLSRALGTAWDLRDVTLGAVSTAAPKPTDRPCRLLSDQTKHMTTSQAYRSQQTYQYDDRFLDREHDDLMDADDYDQRRWERDGWATAHQERGWR